MSFAKVANLLSKESVSIYDVLDSMHEYIINSLFWIFEDNLHLGQTFQHSILPDFSTRLSSGKLIHFYIRLSPGSIVALLKDWEPAQGTKRCVMYAGNLQELESYSTLIESYRDWTSVLITTTDILDYLEEVNTQFTEQIELFSFQPVPLTVKETIDQWFTSAYGLRDPKDFISSVQDSVLEALKYSTVTPAATIANELRKKTFTIVASTPDGLQLATQIKENTLLKYTDCLVPESVGYYSLAEQFPFDVPSLVVLSGRNESAKPLLAITLSRHLPMRQNPFQTFAKAVSSAMAGVPFISISPDRALITRRTAASTIESASPLLYHAYLKLWDLFGVPILALDWPTYYRGTLMYDVVYQQLPPMESIQMRRLQMLVNRVVSHPSESVKALLQDLAVERLRLTMESRRARRGLLYLQDPPLRSAHTLTTRKYISELTYRFPGLSFPPDSLLLEREQTLVVRSRSKVMRPDPYAGTLLLYDIAFARFGRQPVERRRNVVMEFSRVPWNSAASRLFDGGQHLDRPAATREARVFLPNCDALVFADAVLVKDESGRWFLYAPNGSPRPGN